MFKLSTRGARAPREERGGRGGWGEWALVLPTFLQTINWRVGDWTSPLHPNSPVLWLVIPLPLPFQETAQATLYSGTTRTLKPRSHFWSKDKHKRKLKKSAGKSQCENAWNKHKRNHKKNWAYRYLFFCFSSVIICETSTNSTVVVTAPLYTCVFSVFLCVTSVNQAYFTCVNIPSSCLFLCLCFCLPHKYVSVECISKPIKDEILILNHVSLRSCDLSRQTEATSKLWCE